MTGVVIWVFEPADGDQLRELWRQAGFRLIGDDDGAGSTT
jgi:hypothetical protein